MTETIRARLIERGAEEQIADRVMAFNKYARKETERGNLSGDGSIGTQSNTMYLRAGAQIPIFRSTMAQIPLRKADWS